MADLHWLKSLPLARQEFLLEIVEVKHQHGVIKFPRYDETNAQTELLCEIIRLLKEKHGA